MPLIVLTFNCLFYSFLLRGESEFGMFTFVDVFHCVFFFNWRRKQHFWILVEKQKQGNFQRKEGRTTLQ